jgi:glycosyltransferase involved in cell wall biosynthesis
MYLVIITSNYPYGSGEEFLEDEIRIAEKYFSKIILLSCSKSSKITKYLPPNVLLIKSRKSRYDYALLLITLMDLFSCKTIRELLFSYRVLKFTNVFISLKAIYIYYYINRILSPKLVSKQLLDSHTIYYSYWLGPGAFALSNLKKNYPKQFCIARTHGGDCFIDRGYLPFRREILEKLDQIYSISEAGKKSIETKLVSLLKKKTLKIHVQKLGILYHGLTLNPSSTSDVLQIVSCSNIIPLKRLDLIIDTLSEIHSINVKWTHYGDGKSRKKIQAYAQKKLGDKKNITYRFCGHKSKSEVFRNYSSEHVDLFVNCSDYEGIPVSIMEAFSFGIPAIARDVGGNSEIVNSCNGFLIPSYSSVTDLKNSINRFFSMTQKEKKKLSEFAHLTYRSFFNAQENYENFFRCVLKIYREQEELLKKNGLY